MVYESKKKKHPRMEAKNIFGNAVTQREDKVRITMYRAEDQIKLELCKLRRITMLEPP